MNPITGFHRKYDFLSNFYLCPIALDDIDYPSIEHAFQAAKTDDPDERYKLQIAPSPGAAKKMGRRVKLREDWETVKLDIMLDMLRQKFTRHAELRELLLATGDAELIEGNNWNDRYWGAVKKGDEWIGQNHLGRLIMQVRAELKDK